MFIRPFRSVAVVAFVVGGAACAWGQDAAEAEAATSVASEPEAAPPAGNELFDKTATEADNIDDIFGPIDDEQPEPADDAETEAADESMAVADKMEEAGAEMATADAQVQELTQRVVALQQEMEALKATLSNVQQALARAQEPNEFGRRALGAMAEDADLRGDLGQMLQGKVRLVNNTGQSQVIYINGTPWTVVPGDSFVLAPVGTVSFVHDGNDEPIFKGIQEWTTNEENGQFELEYQLGMANAASEQSVLMKLPARTP